MTYGISSEVKRRMVIICTAAFLNSTFAVGVEGILLPLWVTKELGLSAADWAQLRSIRWTGVLVGVVILGALSDRFGQRSVGAASMFIAALALLTMAFRPSDGLWAAMPVFGAMVSTSYVNLNVIVQQVSKKRQGLVNAVYRSLGAAAAVIAPVLATYLAIKLGGYRPALFVFTAVLTTAGFVLLLYRGEAAPPPLGKPVDEIRTLWFGYMKAVKQKELMGVINLSQLWGSLLAGVGAFSAIYFTQSLNRSDAYFGLLSSISGIISFFATASTIWILDRISLRKFCTAAALLGSLCSIMMGISSSVALTSVGFVLFGPVGFLTIAPVSMWISRSAGESSQASAFSVHKFLTAVYVAASMAVLGFLEHLIGMRAVFLYGGLLGAAVGLLFLKLPEPRRNW